MTTIRVAHSEAPIGRATALGTAADLRTDLRADLLAQARAIGAAVGLNYARAGAATRTATAAELARSRYPTPAIRSLADARWVQAQLAKRKAYARNVLAPLLGIEPDAAEAAIMTRTIASTGQLRITR